MSTIRFRIVPPVGRPGEPVFVTGGHPTLGDWDPARALELRWEPPFHAGEVEVPQGTVLEYKLTRGHWETEAVDAFGHVPPNERHEVWMDHTLHHTVADWKDRFSGRLTRESVRSIALAGSRDLLVWLPPGYASDPARRFPLIVLHDGANVFDPVTSVIPGVDLAADELVTALSRERATGDAIVAGVCHPDGFTEEDASLRDFDLSPELGGEAYARFITGELVPYMDTHYRTLARPEARILGGVSLGGLNTFFTFLRHPGVFRGYVGLSAAFEDVQGAPPAHSGQLLALADHKALPAGVRMYFDFGTHGLDECYDGYFRDLGCLLRERGWTDGEEFTIRHIEGGGHDEISWRSRLGDALRFVAR